MQPLHKIYVLITYLTCIICYYKRFFFPTNFTTYLYIYPKVIGIFLQILNFIIYLYINSNYDLKPFKV
jgi:hypothetical protein